MNEQIQDLEEIIIELEKNFDLSGAILLEKLQLASKCQQNELLADISESLIEFINIDQAEED